MPLPLLSPHATVALVCTGTACHAREVAVGAQQFLKNQCQLESVFSEDTYQKTSAEKRAEIFLNYLFDHNISGILALRGGEGTADILPMIHARRAQIKNLTPKLLVGFSDFTPLLIYFAQAFHWPTVHGGGMIRYCMGEIYRPNLIYTLEFLTGKKNQVTIDDLQPLNVAAQDFLPIHATAIGGNLSLLAISVKDCWELGARNKILIIEEVNEKAHKVARTLKYLQRIGLLNEVVAIVFGDFNCTPIGCREAEQATNAAALLKALAAFAKHCDCPVLVSKKIGHGHHNLPIVFNQRYELDRQNLTLRL